MNKEQSGTMRKKDCNTFLVYLTIVFPARKALVGLVYKPAHVSLCSLASSVHHLLSNLVSLP